MLPEQQQRLEAIFRAVLALDPAVKVGAVRRGEIESWDSLAHVMLVAAVENEFGIAIDLGASLHLDSFDAALTLVRECSA
jgi:acyl carrier protein